MTPYSFNEELRKLFDQYAGVSACNQKTIGNKTEKTRKQTLRLCFRQLRQMGYKLRSPYSLGGRHVEALASKWVGQNLSTSTLHNRLSHLRVFTRWINKPGMVLPPGEYPGIPPTRSGIASRDLSPIGNGIDMAQVLDAVREHEPLFYIAMKFQIEFGLRVAESLMIQPHLQDYGAYLLIVNGPKGGRERSVPIMTARQREVVNMAKEAVGRLQSLIPTRLNLKQGYRRYYTVMEAVGFTRDQLGVSSHGLRHEALQRIYREVTGQEPPVRGGAKIERELEKFARAQVARIAGHFDISKSNAYLGKFDQTG